jgi:signal transduction histidine kinase
VTLTFAGLALVISLILALGTYLTARHYLVDQREGSAVRQAFVDASFVRDGLLTSGAEVSDVLEAMSPPAGSVVVLHRNGQWFSSSLSEGAEAVPTSMQKHVDDGSAGMAWTRLGGQPAIAVGVPLPAVDGQFFELVPTTELGTTLGTLATVLAVFAVLTAAGGALIGRAASTRAIAPLDSVAMAAARIAAGQMDTRLPATEDPDLAVIVGSFNTMVEALDERIRRDARFAADVSHELRSPVTALMTSVEVLSASADRVREHRDTTVELMRREVERLHRSLEHLLELGRIDAGVPDHELTPIVLSDLVKHALDESHRSQVLLTADRVPAVVVANKQRLYRAVVNLFDNADLHGGGIAGVQVRTRGDHVVVIVDDDGPGVPLADRSRIFERFARSGSRGSRAGTGLGLSLVAETARAYGGTVWCAESPTGGARFVLRLPLASNGQGEAP